MRVIGVQNATAEESLLAFKSFIQIYLHGKAPTTIRSDSGTEFINELWADFCHSNAIEQQPNPAGSPNSNLIERYMQDLKKQLKVLLGGWSASTNEYWLLAARYATFLRNRAPCDANDGISPHIYLKGQPGFAEWTFILDRLSVFGTKGTILNQESNIRSDCVYVGFDERRLCPIVRNLDTNLIMSTNDAQFFSHPMRDPFSFLAPNADIEFGDPSIDVESIPEIHQHESAIGGENTSTSEDTSISDDTSIDDDSKSIDGALDEKKTAPPEKQPSKLLKLYKPIAIVDHKSKGTGRNRVLQARIRWKGYGPNDDTWEYISPNKPNNVSLSSNWNKMIESYNPRLLRTWSLEALQKSENKLLKSGIKLYNLNCTLTTKEDDKQIEIDTEINGSIITAEYHQGELTDSTFFQTITRSCGDLLPENVEDEEPEIKLVIDNDGEILTNLRVGKIDYLFDLDGKKVEIKTFNVTNQQLYSLNAIYKTIKKKPYKRKPAEIVNGESTPGSINDILKHEHRDLWIKAYYEELENLDNAGTFKRVLRKTYPNINPLKWKLVCKIKTDQAGNTVRRKVRYTCRGDLTKEHIHYGETYSPTVQVITLRTIISIATTYNLKGAQIDITAAFLYGILEKLVLSEFPRYWDQYKKGNRSHIEEENDKNYIAIMRRSVYGLKDAASLFYRNFRKTIEKLGFNVSKTDNCLFYKGDLHKDDFMVMCSFVDDLTLFASNENLIKEFVQELFKIYKGTFEEDLKYIIGIEINELEDKVTLDQQKYLRLLLDRNKFNTSKENLHKETRVTPLPTDAVFSSKLRNDDELLIGNEITQYQSVVGALLYLHSRPDIAYAVGKLCRFMHAPTSRHFSYARHVLKYLRKHPTYGLKYNRKGDNILRCYTDSSYLDDPDSGKTTLGYVITLNGGPVAYKSKLSKLVLHSTCEAEYVAMYEGLVIVLQLRTLMQELGVEQKEPTPMRCDNQAAVTLSTAETEPPSYRHIAMRYHALREAQKYVAIRFIPTKENLADLFTKPLPTATFRKLVEELMIEVPKFKEDDKTTEKSEEVNKSNGEMKDSVKIEENDEMNSREEVIQEHIKMD